MIRPFLNAVREKRIVWRSQDKSNSSLVRLLQGVEPYWMTTKASRSTAKRWNMTMILRMIARRWRWLSLATMVCPRADSTLVPTTYVVFFCCCCLFPVWARPHSNDCTCSLAIYSHSCLRPACNKQIVLCLSHPREIISTRVPLFFLTLRR